MTNNIHTTSMSGLHRLNATHIEVLTSMGFELPELLTTTQAKDLLTRAEAACSGLNPVIACMTRDMLADIRTELAL